MKFLFFGGLMPEMQSCFNDVGYEVKCIGFYDLFRSNKIETIQQIAIQEFTAYEPDVLVVFKGMWTYEQRISNSTILWLKKKYPNCIFVYWSLDDPYFYASGIMPADHVKGYDVIFTCCKESIKFYQEKYNKKAFLLYPAFDTTLWKYLPSSENAKIDFRVIGSCYNTKGRFARAEVAQRIIDKGYEIELYGPEDQWITEDKTGRSVTSGNSNLAKYYKYNCDQSHVHHLYCTTKVNFNSHFHDAYGYLNSRVFEVMGCGAFMLCDRVDGITETFEEDVEIVLFDNLDEFEEKFEFYVKNPVARQSICLAAMQKILKEHTYTHRTNKMIDIIYSDLWR